MGSILLFRRAFHIDMVWSDWKLVDVVMLGTQSQSEVEQRIVLRAANARLEAMRRQSRLDQLDLNDSEMT